MDINNITSLIANIGFPIACVIAMGFFIKYMYDTDNEKTAKFTEAINALKISIDVLVSKIAKDDDDENEGK